MGKQTPLEVLTPEQVNALRRACRFIEDEALMARDRAIFELLVTTGLRASELCALRVARARLTPDEPLVVVEAPASRGRLVLLEPQARAALARYVERYRPHTTGDQRLFLEPDGRPMTADVVNRTLARLRRIAEERIAEERAGKPLFGATEVTAAILRDTFAVNFLQGGGNPEALGRVLGYVPLSSAISRYVDALSKPRISVLERLQREEPPDR